MQLWLKSDFVKSVFPGKGCTFCDDEDVDNKRGWQVYFDDDEWVNVPSNISIICGIRPAYIWFGK